jgi:hypothetical protein
MYTFIQEIVVKMFVQKVCKQSVAVPSAHKKSALGEGLLPNNLVIAKTQDICRRYIYLRNSCENVCPESLQSVSSCPQRSQKA